MDKDTEQKIGQLQMIEQNMQSFGLQKQNFQAALLDSENALKEIEISKGEAYKIVGGMMINSDKEALKKELNARVEMVKLRLKTIEDQEKNLSEKAKKIQEEVVGKLKK